MKTMYEIIDRESHFPIALYSLIISSSISHWHEEGELIFILDGQLEVSVEGQISNLEAGDLFFVNKLDIHSYTKERQTGLSHMLCLHLKEEYFQKYDVDLSEIRFNLNSVKAGKEMMPYFRSIRILLARILDCKLNNSGFLPLHLERHALDLLLILLHKFKSESSPKFRITNKESGRMRDILEYINRNILKPELNVQSIADHFNYNYQYFSQFFKEQTGTSLKKYIEATRLKKSLYSLQASNKKIIDIALHHGFPDAKSYYRVFKEIMQQTPKTFREQRKLRTTEKIRDLSAPVERKEPLARLFKYIEILEEENLSVIKEKKQIIINTSNNEGHYRNKANVLTTFDYAPHGLRNDFQEQLKELQKDIGFSYIRFHGIFADQLKVYNETHEGIYYNFNHLDSLLDTLVRLDIKPYIELGFMPSQLSKSASRLFWWDWHLSPPSNMTKWTDLIKGFIIHIIQRYGLTEIRSWYFEFWSAPELEGIFWQGTKEDFFDFFKESYRTIKAIDSQIKLGGFGSWAYEKCTQWIKDFLVYAEKHDIHPDFYSFQVFPQKMDEIEGFAWIQDLMEDELELHSIDQIHSGLPVTLGGPSQMEDSFRQFVALFRETGITAPLWVNTWNSSNFNRDLVHDTCFMGPFIIKNILSCQDDVEAMGFWTFTDIFDEMQLSQPLFHGGFGLMTFTGLKKPSYHAFSFLSRLKGRIITRGENYLVVGNDDRISIIAYNYCHYNELYRRFDNSQISQQNRYKVFEAGEKITLEFSLAGLPLPLRVEEQKVSRKEGSVFDAWVKSGAPENPGVEAHAYLRAKSLPQYRIYELNSKAVLEIALEPHDFALIEVKTVLS